MSHWAAPLIGKPWEPGATGPHAFDCWGLVRYVLAQHRGIEVPQVAVCRRDDDAMESNVAAIKRAVGSGGWRRVDAPGIADDIVLMSGRAGRHIGLMVRANGMLGVLHADGEVTKAGPVGCVMFQSLRHMTQGGYSTYEFWRRVP